MASLGSETHSRSAPHSLTLCRLNTPIILALCNLQVARRLVSAPTSIMLLRPPARSGLLRDENNARIYTRERECEHGTPTSGANSALLLICGRGRTSQLCDGVVSRHSRAHCRLALCCALARSQPPLCRLVMYCCNGPHYIPREAKRELQRGENLRCREAPELTHTKQS
jgi:hypothetical protein